MRTGWPTDSSLVPWWLLSSHNSIHPSIHPSDQPSIHPSIHPMSGPINLLPYIVHATLSKLRSRQPPPSQRASQPASQSFIPSVRGPLLLWCVPNCFNGQMSYEHLFSMDEQWVAMMRNSFPSKAQQATPNPFPNCVWFFKLTLTHDFGAERTRNKP